MRELIDQKNRKAAKQHSCDYCGGIIKKGELYAWSKCLYDGSFFEWRTHLACDRVASAIWDYAEPDEGMTDQLFMDKCQEVCQVFICPDCENWNEEFQDCEMDESYCIDRMDKFFETHELYNAGREGYAHVWKCRNKVNAARATGEDQGNAAADVLMPGC